MRISCASFVRIMSPDGQFALLVNKNQYNQGKIVLVPVGGAMQISRAEAGELMDRLDLTEADFDKPPTDVVDLRFTVNEALVEEVRRLYPTWTADPTRELYEELVDETGILTAAEYAAANFTLTFAGLGEERATSARTGKAAGQETLRLISIYDLSCEESTAERLYAVGFPLLFVTAKEILAERSATNAKIASIAKTLLAPQATLG